MEDESNIFFYIEGRGTADGFRAKGERSFFMKYGARSDSFIHARAGDRASGFISNHRAEGK